MLNQLLQVSYPITSMARLLRFNFYDSDRDPEYTPNNLSLDLSIRIDI